MGKKNNLFERFDQILESGSLAVEYAEKHFKELHDKEEKAVKKVMTSQGYGLGVACPSLIRHKVISGHKKGRVIKEVPKEDNYMIISYDEKGEPVAVRDYNKFGSSGAEYFFEFNGYIWVVSLYDEKGTRLYYDIYRILFKDGKIQSFYSMSSVHLSGEEYEYPEDEREPIRCKWYDYVPGRVGASKKIPAGYEHSPMSEYLYEISRDGKKIAEYKRVEEGYDFCRKYVSGSRRKSAAPKPAPDTFERFSKWLDEELEKELPDRGSGVYFSLSEGTEDGFDIIMCFTEHFDKENEEWACNVIEQTEAFTVFTNGECQWQDILVFSVKLIKQYFQKGNKQKVLKSFAGAGVGFDDGDVEIVND